MRTKDIEPWCKFQSFITLSLSVVGSLRFHLYRIDGWWCASLACSSSCAPLIVVVVVAAAVGGAEVVVVVAVDSTVVKSDCSSAVCTLGSRALDWGWVWFGSSGPFRTVRAPGGCHPGTTAVPECPASPFCPSRHYSAIYFWDQSSNQSPTDGLIKNF